MALLWHGKRLPLEGLGFCFNIINIDLLFLSNYECVSSFKASAPQQLQQKFVLPYDKSWGINFILHFILISSVKNSETIIYRISALKLQPALVLYLLLYIYSFMCVALLKSFHNMDNFQQISIHLQNVSITILSEFYWLKNLPNHQNNYCGWLFKI